MNTCQVSMMAGALVSVGLYLCYVNLCGALRGVRKRRFLGSIADRASINSVRVASDQKFLAKNRAQTSLGIWVAKQ